MRGEFSVEGEEDCPQRIHLHLFWGSHPQRGQSQCSFQVLSKLDVGPSFWVSRTQNHRVFHLLGWFCFVELDINSFERDWCPDCMDQALTMVHTAEWPLLNPSIHLGSLENSFIPGWNVWSLMERIWWRKELRFYAKMPPPETQTCISNASLFFF